MIASWTLNDELASRSRLANYALSPRASAAAQLSLLISLGVFAAILTSIAASPIRLPGHAILRGTLPLICGLSLAPRRGAGTIMSLAAMLAFAAMSLFAAPRIPFAAVAGLAMLGPLLDVATTRVTTRAANLGWQLYLSFALFGALAGLVCGVIWFRANPRVRQGNTNTMEPQMNADDFLSASIRVHLRFQLLCIPSCRRGSPLPEFPWRSWRPWRLVFLPLHFS